MLLQAELSPVRLCGSACTIHATILFTVLHKCEGAEGCAHSPKHWCAVCRRVLRLYWQTSMAQQQKRRPLTFSRPRPANAQVGLASASQKRVLAACCCLLRVPPPFQLLNPWWEACLQAVLCVVFLDSCFSRLLCRLQVSLLACLGCHDAAYGLCIRLQCSSMLNVAGGAACRAGHSMSSLWLTP